MKQSDARKTPIFRRVVEGPVYRFSRWLTVLSAIAALIIMVLVTVDVLMRRFLNMPITGSFEISCALLVVIIFCCVAWVMTERGHIVVDIISSRYPQRLGAVMSTIALFFSMIVVGLICWGSIRFGLDQFRVGEASVLLHLPVAPFIFVLAFGSALLAVVILIQFINSLAGSKEG
jgi:TRAP-type C4-dicarboxylate transport system permease small subunit